MERRGCCSTATRRGRPPRAGYGNQCALFAPRLAEHYDLKISAFYGLEATPLEWNEIKILPGDGHGYGQGSMTAHAERFFGNDGGLLFTLMDVWVLDPSQCAQFDMVCWTPVDHEPAPPMVRAFFQRSQAIPLAMTRNGCDMLREFEPLYCPHAIDCEVFQPMGRELARKRLGIDQDTFLVGMVGANKGNPSRKSFVATLEAFAKFRARHDNAILYLHTDLQGELAGGVPLVPVMEALGLPEASVKFADQYRIQFDPIPPQLMALLYSAMDVLVNPTTGGGFEIPLVEAQACGIPVITTDFTAMREVGAVGWKVRGSRTWTPQQSWQMVPHVHEILRALEGAYRLSDTKRELLADKARTHALRYDINRVMDEHMLPSLRAAEDRLARRRPLTVAARSAV